MHHWHSQKPLAFDHDGHMYTRRAFAASSASPGTTRIRPSTRS
jgi:hypothetical protein